METGEWAREAVKVEPVGSHDSASPVEVLKAVDLAMRQYFGGDDWLTIRNRLSPGLRRQL